MLLADTDGNEPVLVAEGTKAVLLGRVLVGTLVLSLELSPEEEEAEEEVDV
jgi:hypothetical protein